MILVVGFGPFFDVVHNPAARLARALDGVGRCLGREIPVSYARGPGDTLDLAASLGVQRVLGIGVARGAVSPRVERLGYNQSVGLDVDGQCPDLLDPTGPPVVRLAGPSDRFAAALGCPTSDHAGRYVCNAWAYRLACSDREAMFLHVPDTGLDPAHVAFALGAVWG